MDSDSQYLLIALEEARQAALENEVPVGAVLVVEEKILAQNHNRIVQQKDPLAHAELLVLQTAMAGNPEKWLLDATLYVTLEPCAMCAGALVLARVKRLVYATPDPKSGACGSIMDIVRSPHLNHRMLVESGLLHEKAAALLTGFFQKLRMEK